MKTFNIPIYNRRFRIYVGEQEREKFYKTIKEMGSDDDEIDESRNDKAQMGISYGSEMWVHDKADAATIIHELSHCIDSFMLGFLDSDNTEVRAYFTEYLMVRVLKAYGHLA